MCLGQAMWPVPVRTTSLGTGTMPKNSKETKDKGKAGANGKGEPKAAGNSASKTPAPLGADTSALHLGEQEAAASGEGGSRRKLGLRGAAPWAARHAAKHAAEARARAAVPPPPGSARATIRVPTGAEELKARISELHQALLQVRGHRKNLAKGFYDVGLVLRDIQQRKLYEAKGYGTFEAFLEREIDLGKTLALRLIRIASTFMREAALSYGLDKLTDALAPLEQSDGGRKSGTIAIPTLPPANRIALPLKPPLRGVG
jgi:hypothetical protein